MASDTGSNASTGYGMTGYPIARAFAFVVLLALIGLVALRHLFGSIRVEGGVR